MPRAASTSLENAKKFEGSAVEDSLVSQGDEEQCAVQRSRTFHRNFERMSRICVNHHEKIVCNR
jgi:hypothetical protein